MRPPGKPRSSPRGMAARGAIMQALAALLLAILTAPVVHNTTLALHTALGGLWPFSLAAADSAAEPVRAEPLRLWARR